MKDYEIIEDDRSEAVNKMTVKVPDSCDGSDAEIFVSEWLEKEENRVVESFGSPTQVEIEPGVFLIRWN